MTVNWFEVETESSLIQIEATADNTEEALVVNVFVGVRGWNSIRIPNLQLTMDEARQVIAGLAAVIR